MSVLIVPALDREPWPTLGPQVWEWMVANLVYGPGDLRGISLREQPPDEEFQALLYRMYEVYPKGHPQAGRRRFKRVGLSQRKGTAKTEKGAWISAAELHPEAPVRCDGWRKVGKHYEPVGVGVRDPFIPLVAYTEEQTDELAYNALYTIVSEGPLADDFDIGRERIMRLNGAGKAVALAGAPNSRDGARTTFQFFDETHRMTLDRLRDAHTTMLANIPKRKLADAWTLETTTAFSPGEGSVAEGTMAYAQAVAKGRIRDSRLFFFHRQASDRHDLSTVAGQRAAILEASGPTAEWTDVDSIVSLRQDPKADVAYWERVWTNRPTQSARQAFSASRWAELARRDPAKRPLIVIGVDGARFRDCLAVIATDVASGFQWVIGIWRRPKDAPPDYEHPAGQIDETVREAVEDEDWYVWRIYIDPQWIDHLFERWRNRWGEERVLPFYTHRLRQTAAAISNYAEAIVAGDVTHDGDPAFAEHIANARRRELKLTDDQEQPLWLIEKERSDSPNKIDAAMAGMISWEARGDAIAANAKPPGPAKLVTFS